MHHYPHHIGDYKAATAHLSNEEDLAYRRLIEMYYDTEQPIPLETQWVARRIRVDIKIIQSVLDDFFLRSDDGWRHDRCDKELADYHQMQEKNRANGKKGGRPTLAKPLIPKENNPVGSQSDASGMPVVTHSKGNQEPGTKNHKEEDKSSSKRAAKKCPADFVVTDTMLEWAGIEAPQVDLQQQTAIFRDHTFKDAKTDWPATWRNWMRKAQEKAAEQPRAGKQAGTVLSFAAQDRLEGIRRWEQQTGELHPDRPAEWPTPKSVVTIEETQVKFLGLD